jgi:N-acetylglucosaminyl-diphospho-decaprenol L-rhamnosyltransferase
MLNNNKLSVIIVTYNSCSVIEECLESICLYNDIDLDLEVVIVDNSPHKNISSVIQNLNLSLNIKYIHNPKNGGFGQGNNIGALHSSGDVLFFLNPDTILTDQIFSFILEQYRLLNITISGFRLTDRDGKDVDSVGILPEYNFIYIPRWVLNFLVIRLGLMTNWIYPWGADFIIRKESFVRAGMFDEKMFLCNEEPDLVKRVGSCKIKIFNKKIIHLEGHTTKLHKERFSQWLKTTQYYLEKHTKSYKRFILIFMFRNFSKLILKQLFFKNNDLEKSVNKMLLEERRRIK